MSTINMSQHDDVAPPSLSSTDETNDIIWFRSTLANSYTYLSNFFPHVTSEARETFDLQNQQEINPDDDFSFVVDGKRYATVEHYYFIQKYIKDYPEQAELIRTEAKTAVEAKKLNILFKSQYPNLSSFDEEKVMLEGLRAKFTQNKLLGKLLQQTKGRILHEQPGKTDSRWSNDENLLGRLLMQVRDELSTTDF